MAANPDAAPLELKKASMTPGAGVPNDAANTASTCYLLKKIPAEMRNTIYELVFTVDHDENAPVDLRKAAPPSKGLVMTCRQIHEEAHGLYKSAYRNFWQSTIFTMTPDATLSRRIEALRGDDLQHIHYVTGCQEHNDLEEIIEYSMLSSNGAWQVTVVKHGTKIEELFCVMTSESSRGQYLFAANAQEARDKSTESLLKPTMKQQLALVARWLRDKS